MSPTHQDEFTSLLRFVRRSQGPSRRPDAVPVGPRLFTKILCAIDFSPASLKGLDYAVSLAKLSQAQLHVLHVVQPVADYMAAGMSDIDVPTMRAAAESRLHDIVVERLGKRVTVSEGISVGKPSQLILQTADEQAVDLLVLGVADRSGFDMMFFGSTANQVIRRAKCPVLTVRD